MNPLCETTAAEQRPGLSPVESSTRGLECADSARWNEYVLRHPAASILHRAEWESVYRVYRLPVLRLAAERDGNLVGVLPLVWQKSFLFGNQLVSLPWFDAADVLCDDRAAFDELVVAAQRAARVRGGAVVQLRQSQPAELDCPVRTEKVLMRLKLASDPERLWKSLSAKVRNQVRKGQKSDLVFESGGHELLPEFYAVYS